MNEESGKLLEKARHAIHAAEVLVQESEGEFAAGRAYYAMFYVAEALLNEKGLRSRKHSGVHQLFWEHFIQAGLIDARFHRWLIDAFDQRLQGDYSFQAIITAADAAETIEQALQFLGEAERVLAAA